MCLEDPLLASPVASSLGGSQSQLGDSLLADSPFSAECSLLGSPDLASKSPRGSPLAAAVVPCSPRVAQLQASLEEEQSQHRARRLQAAQSEAQEAKAHLETAQQARVQAERRSALLRASATFQEGLVAACAGIHRWQAKTAAAKSRDRDKHWKEAEPST